MGPLVFGISMALYRHDDPTAAQLEYGPAKPDPPVVGGTPQLPRAS